MRPTQITCEEGLALNGNSSETKSIKLILLVVNHNVQINLNINRGLVAKIFSTYKAHSNT